MYSGQEITSKLVQLKAHSAYVQFWVQSELELQTAKSIVKTTISFSELDKLEQEKL